MKTLRYYLFLLVTSGLVFLWSAGHASAFKRLDKDSLTVAKLFTDHMVLQRNQPVNVWGTAEANQRVSIKFISSSYSTTADETGHWNISLPPMEAGGPFEMEINDGDTAIHYEDVYVGDVWLASGQSNMAFRLRGAKDPDKETLIREAGKYNIRRYEIAKIVGGGKLLDETDKPWAQADPSNAEEWSAVAFYFASGLYEHLDIPIGIIDCSQGGSRIEAWMSPETLQKTDVPEKTFEGVFSSYKNPSVLYTQMLSGIIPFTLKGVIWYQGESNDDKPDAYEKLLTGMIRQWRTEWHQPGLPFLFAQLPDFERRNDETGESWARLRQAQEAVAQSEPHTGMVVLIDAGDKHDIHPRNKKVVGERFVRAARAVAYDEDVDYVGPVLKKVSYKGKQAVVTYDGVKGELVVKGEAVAGFSVCGKDGQWVMATAKVQNGRVSVSHPEIDEIRGVRYAWANAPDVNLYDENGLPAAPFIDTK